MTKRRKRRALNDPDFEAAFEIEIKTGVDDEYEDIMTKYGLDPKINTVGDIGEVLQKGSDKI